MSGGVTRLLYSPPQPPTPALQAGGLGEVTHSGAARPWLHDVLGVSHPGNNGPVRRCSAAARHVLRWRRSYDAAVPWLLWRRCTQLALHCLGGGWSTMFSSLLVRCRRLGTTKNCYTSFRKDRKKTFLRIVPLL